MDRPEYMHMLRDLDDELCEDFEKYEQESKTNEKTNKTHKKKVAKDAVDTSLNDKQMKNSKNNKKSKKDVINGKDNNEQSKNSRQTNKNKTDGTNDKDGSLNDEQGKNSRETNTNKSDGNNMKDASLNAEEQSNDDDAYVSVTYPQPNLIFRGGWAAWPPKSKTPLTHPIGQIVYTFTGGEECHSDEECSAAVQRLQQEHMAEGMPDIQFNFLVGGDLKVYEGRGWFAKATKKPVHSYIDKDSIDIAYIGDFTDKDPDDGMIGQAGGILQYGVNNGYLLTELNIASIRDEQSENAIVNEMEKHKGAPLP